MLQFQVIGNLGADAQVKDINGRKFVTFDVAHSNSWADDAGTQHSDMIWVSCIMAGDGGNLLPYLTKGKKVFVSGDGSVKVYSSKVQRRMMAGANLSVRQIELLGGSSDEVPRQLITLAGEVLDVYKAYYINPGKAEELCPKKDDVGTLVSQRGEFYEVKREGWVTKQENHDGQQDDAETF